jgi:hypothetical protein
MAVRQNRENKNPMKTSFLQIGAIRENVQAGLLRFRPAPPVALASIIGVITLAHFTALMLLATFCMMMWLVHSALCICSLLMLPVDLSFSHVPGHSALLALTQPLYSLPLPHWLWHAPLAAVFLAALNSLFWGIGLGVSAFAVWGILRGISRRVVATIGASRLVAKTTRPAHYDLVTGK